MTTREGGRPKDAARRRQAHRGVMAVGLALSALIHATILLHGHLTVPEPTNTPESRRADGTDEPALRVVTLAPEPVPSDASAVTSRVPAEGAPEPASPASDPSAPAAGAPLDLAAIAPASVGRPSLSVGELGETGIETFDLRPTAPVRAAAPVEAVEAEAEGPSFLRRALGGLLKGVSVAIRVPCGADGAPGAPVPGGAPAVPDGGGMPGLPGVTGEIPRGRGMPTPPEPIGTPAIPDPTFGGTDGPVAGVRPGGALAGLIGCEDGSRQPGSVAPGGLGGRGGIFRPGGGFPLVSR